MSLVDDVTKALKEAMVAKDRLAKDTIQAIRGEILLLKKDPSHGDVSDDDVVKICKKLIKQRQDAIIQFIKGDRQDLADKDQAQIEIIKKFLPEALSEDELAALVDEAIAEVGAEGMKDMGKVMGSVKGKVAATGKDADGKTLADLVKSKLQG